MTPVPRQAFGAPDELIAAVSHELRQPLVSIRGFTEMLVDHWADFTDEDKVGMLHQVLHDAKRVGRLIDDLLDVSRTGSGQFSLHGQPTDVAQLVGRALTDLEPSYPGLGATVEIPKNWPKVSVDPFRMEQVVINVVENACKYGDPGTVTVKVVPGPEEVAIEISDRGKEISPEDLSHVTDKFYRGACTEGEGLGLGLWISRMIVGAHGGRLTAQSGPSEGTRAQITIPLQDCPPTGKLAGQ